MKTFTFDPDGDEVIRGPATMDGNQYFMVFKYDKRNDRWRLDLLDVDSELIIAGVKLVTDLDLLIPFSDPRLPTGELFATRIEGELLPVTRDELGSIVVITYITRLELDIMEFFSVALTETPPIIGIAV